MEVLWCALLLIFCIFCIQRNFRKQQTKLPPNPPVLPILGHVHLLKGPTHIALQHLFAKYGPIIYLRIGNRPTLVVSSPSIVEECFTKNDIIFANRPRSIALDYLSYNYTVIGSAPYGDHWRNLRRVTTLKMFSSTAVGHFSAIREEEIRFIVQKLSSSSGGKVNVNSLLMEFVSNVIMKMVAGKRWSGPYGMFDSSVPTGLADFIPILKWIDYGGFKKKMEVFRRKNDNVLQNLIDESRRESRDEGGSSSTKQNKTLIQILLSLQETQPEYYTDDIIKGIILIPFSAGIDTSAKTMEWTMSLLLNHPEVMEKLRKEIDLQITSSGRLVADSDLSKLPYLHSVINEGLRMFPVAPTLLPHLSSRDCTVAGYHIPSGTTLMVNAYAIHRDPNVWEKPTEFKPERFEGIKKENEGFKFLPFGAGRRACPGSVMAIRTIALALATFVQCFDWERIGSELVDLEEGLGFVIPKAEPLEAHCRPRASVADLWSQI